MIVEIDEELKRRGIRRLCHFTPSRNLQHIAAGKLGVLSTAALSDEERAAYNPTDLERYDGRKTHICCSIEYPNGWYFARARDKEPLFTDWVVLLLRPQLLAQDGTLFSPGNAAAGGGRHLAEGFKAFQSLFADAVAGKNANYVRTPQRLPACPTDQQAEVLIEDRIPMEEILGVAVASEKQGLIEMARLRANGVDPAQFHFVSAPHMFNKHQLSAVIQNGATPAEPRIAPPTQKGGTDR